MYEEFRRAYNDFTGAVSSFDVRDLNYIGRTTLTPDEAIEVADEIGGYNDFRPDVFREVVKLVTDVDPEARFRPGRSGSVEWWVESEHPARVRLVVVKSVEKAEVWSRQSVSETKAVDADTYDFPPWLVRLWWD